MIESPLEKIKRQADKINSGPDKRQYNTIELLSYNRSHNGKLDIEQLGNDIKLLDKSSIENLIKKCQRLYLIKKYKLYRELGYNNINEYAQEEHNINRNQVSKYCRVFEKLEIQLLELFQNVSSTIHFEQLSIEKFNLIAKIEEEEKIEEYLSRISNEEVSVRQLETELKDKKLIYTPQKQKNENTKSDFQNSLDQFKKTIPLNPTLDDMTQIDNIILDLLKIKGNGNEIYKEKQLNRNENNPLISITFDILDMIFNITHYEKNGKMVKCRYPKINKTKKEVLNKNINKIIDFLGYLKFHL